MAGWTHGVATLEYLVRSKVIHHVRDQPSRTRVTNLKLLENKPFCSTKHLHKNENTDHERRDRAFIATTYGDDVMRPK